MYFFKLFSPAGLGFVFFLVSHATFSRFGTYRLFFIIKTAFSALALAIVVLGILGSADLAAFFVSFPAYCFLILAYLHLFIGTSRSVSVRILEELARNGGHLTLAGLENLYPKEWMFVSRLDVLKNNDWISEKHGNYSCTTKGIFFARLIRFLRGLYGIGKAG